jgi:hypothetical protein
MTMNHRLRLTDTISRIVHACLLGLLFSPLAFAGDGDRATSTLFYQPSLLKDQSQRFSAWSHSIAFSNGKFVNAVAVKEFIDQPTDMGLAIFESDDGVHWRETAPFACPLPRAVPGYCWRWDGEAFVYFITEGNTGPDRKEYPAVVRQHRSVDLKNWEFMGDEFTTRPDNRWYRCRWDELVILEDGENFYGYITSEPRPELARDSMGMLQSADGLRWEVLPPPVFEWDGLPPQQMEVCLCEKIGDRYYLGMGSRSYMGHLGFSVVMFVSDSPTGPFRPDKEAFRLCGNKWGIVEINVHEAPDATVGKQPGSLPGIYFECEDGGGETVLFTPEGQAHFGRVNADGTGFQPYLTREIGRKPGARATFRIVQRDDLAEIYLDDYQLYIMHLRKPPTGRLGFIASGGQNVIGDVRAWYADPNATK